MFRLKQKHSKKRTVNPAPVDPAVLTRAQSVRSALIAAALTAIVITTLWVWLTMTTGKFFPWFGILQGALVGLAVQSMGRGLDWRFPAIAAAAAAIGSFAGGFFVALTTTEVELQASAVSILRGLTSMTWEIYFEEVITPVDYIYAFSAAAVGAFFAKRRLNRHEEFALRTAKPASGGNSKEENDESVR